jgi:hypothetical protein
MAASAPRYVGRVSRRNYDRASRHPEVQATIRRAARRLGWEPHVLYCRTPCQEYIRFHGLGADKGEELWKTIQEPDRFPELDSYRKVMHIAFEWEQRWGRTPDDAALAVARWYISRQRIPWWRWHKRGRRIREEQSLLIKSHLAQAT